jgi:hypothetical protein
MPKFTVESTPAVREEDGEFEVINNIIEKYVITFNADEIELARKLELHPVEVSEGIFCLTVGDLDEVESIITNFDYVQDGFDLNPPEESN